MVAERLTRLPLGKDVTVHSQPELNLSLIEKFEGASAVVLVDALRSGKPPGAISVYTISGRGDPPVELPSLHGLRLPDLVALAGESGLLSCRISVVGVEPKNCKPGKRISREIRSALPLMIDKIVAALRTS